MRPRDVAEDRVLAEKLHRAIGATKIMNPPTNCLSPIGDVLMKRGLVSFLNVIETEGPEADEQLDLDHAAKKKASKKEKAAKAAAPEVPDAPPEEGVEKIKGHNYFIATVTRPPKVYRGNPFQVEVGLAYGGSWPADKPIELFRFANRVPLLFQRGACGMTEAIVKTDWRNYLLSQPKGSLPVGPDGAPRPHRVGVGAVHERGEGGRRALPGDHPGRSSSPRRSAAASSPRTSARRSTPTTRRSAAASSSSTSRRSRRRSARSPGKSPEPIKREFLRLADQVTEAELAEQDAALEEQSKKITKRPRRAEEEEE